MKKIISAFLALVLLLGMLPAGTPTASAMYTWLKDRELVSGSDFTRSAKMAEKLDAIFDGNANIYQDVKCTQLVDVRFGSSAVPNNNVYKYIGPEGGPAICSGTSCWVYANGVYYTLFGESTFSGVAGPNSEMLTLGSNRIASYEKFLEWGVRPAVGALVRAAGHSMIVLGYDAQSLTILDGNGDGRGLISIRIRSWDEIDFSVSYIIQPKEEFYNASYPGWSMPAIKNAYPASCYLEVTEEEAFVESQPGGADSLQLERTVAGIRYTAHRLLENEAGELWYAVRTQEGVEGYLPAAAARWLEDREDIGSSGISAPSHHPEGQKFDLSGYVLAQSSELTAVSALVYRHTEEGQVAVSGGEASAVGHWYNLSKSPMDEKKTFASLTEGAYTYEVAASYARCHVDAEGTVVTQTGKAVVYTAEVQVTVGAVLCSHAYEVTQLIAPGCNSAGMEKRVCKHCAAQQTQWLPATGKHTYADSVAQAAACEQEGIRAFACADCAAGHQETIAALGHGFGQWQVAIAPGCETEGLQKRFCERCSAEEALALSPEGHSYASQWVEANCSDYGHTLFACQNCAASYSEYPESDADWSETRPEDVSEEKLETKLLFRYRTYETVLSPLPELPGYALEDSWWVVQESGTRSYAKAWPSGFQQSHSLYAAYGQPVPEAAETEREKIVVGEETPAGWLYYHWCANTYTAGPINRGGKAVPSEKYNTFHAFYSTVSPSTLTDYPDGSYIHSNADCCRDTYWYFIVPVYTCDYTAWRKEYAHIGWSEWSAWQEEAPEAAATCQVESKIFYRVGNLLGDHCFTESAVTREATCLAEGVETLGCRWCDAEKRQPIPRADHRYAEGKCIWCLAKDPDFFAITPPADETVKLGNRAAFTVGVNGEAKAYQWQYQMAENGPWWNCTQYTMGYNTPQLNVIAAEKRQGFLYRCRITDMDGKKHYSDPAKLTVDIPEQYAVLSQPQEAWVMPGRTAAFHIETQGEGLTFQWEYHKGVDKTGPQYYWIPMGSTAGCKTDTLTIAGISGSTNRDGWAYRCVVTDPNGYVYTTEHAILHVAAAQIDAQPESQTVSKTGKAQFRVEVSGQVASYQWQYSKDGGKSWYSSTSSTQGYNTAALTVAGASGSTNRNGFLYRCVITDIDGNRITSAIAKLTVQ